MHIRRREAERGQDPSLRLRCRVGVLDRFEDRQRAWPEARKQCTPRIDREVVEERPADELLGVVGSGRHLLYGREALGEHGTELLESGHELGDVLGQIRERLVCPGRAVCQLDEFQVSTGELGNIAEQDRHFALSGRRLAGSAEGGGKVHETELYEMI